MASPWHGAMFMLTMLKPKAIHRYSSSYRFDGQRWGKLEWCFWFNRILLFKKIRNWDTRPATYIIDIFPRQEVKSKLVRDLKCYSKVCPKNALVTIVDYFMLSRFFMSDIIRICLIISNVFFFIFLIFSEKIWPNRRWRKARSYCTDFLMVGLDQQDPWFQSFMTQCYIHFRTLSLFQNERWCKPFRHLKWACKV